jgi:hypothetical protein
MHEQNGKAVRVAAFLEVNPVPAVDVQMRLAKWFERRIEAIAGNRSLVGDPVRGAGAQDSSLNLIGT